ncbi:(2Fe-2S)-binding protein [Bradyrhizobium sp. NP1]|uniref:(2Fe-2S)-binding protein n=1 Tax=Bradyrhizobium sp. NP1 TaxID=3049772 RepID=UPI0025A63483|nr:(2Fe-2S)-binding protein [Bradyrhizobium sp. NP1]WJR81694.1 (2Fe-2S)-binding protein [Bradyrhizobium sp. NP1]
MAISFTLNEREVAAEFPPNRLLIDLLRDHFKLKGTKRSCDMEVCGACTVLLNGQPVSSCTTLAADADQGSIVTIEGLSPEAGLSRIQQAFVDHGAAQCGFCTPGFIVAVTDLLSRNPSPSDDEIRHHLRGNLCRCTGYVKILEAVKSLVPPGREGVKAQVKA